MPERTSYAPGSPSFVDIGTDLDAAIPFYTELFGWTVESMGPNAGSYGMFLRNGKVAAGHGPKTNPGPPVWTTYVTVADVDAACGTVTGAGGTVVLPPMDVFTAGRMAVVQDPQGGVVSLWQAGDSIGCEVVDEPGSFTWTELLSRDPDGSKAFYTEVFGWTAETHAGGPMPYTEFQLAGTSVAGMMGMPPMVPPEVPTYWNVYFAVADLDASRAKVAELGGSELFPPMEIAVGRFCGVQDPQGATFTIIQLAGGT